MGPLISDTTGMEAGRRRLPANGYRHQFFRRQTRRDPTRRDLYQALKRPDLWGDEAKPHPRGTYRVIFTFTHDLSTIGEASFGNRICPLRANPVVFTEM